MFSAFFMDQRLHSSNWMNLGFGIWDLENEGKEKLDPGFGAGRPVWCASHRCFFFVACCGYRRISARSPHKDAADDGPDADADQTIAPATARLISKRLTERTREYQIVHVCCTALCC